MKKEETSFRIRNNNNDLIFRKEVNGYLYEVSCDCDAIYHDKDCFEDEKEYQEHIDKYNRGHFAYFIVEKFKKCGCCDSPISEDVLCGIQAEYAEKALDYYLVDYA